jgi:hypothetical protein
LNKSLLHCMSPELAHRVVSRWRNSSVAFGERSGHQRAALTEPDL